MKHVIPPVCNVLVATFVELVLMKTNGSLASTKSLLMFSENNHDPDGPSRCPGALAAEPYGVKG